MPILACFTIRLFHLPWASFPPSVTLRFLVPAPPIPPVFLVVVYGFWWAAGVAANPYLRQRGATVFVRHLLLYFVVWFVLAKVLFNPGPLGFLL